MRGAGRSRARWAAGWQGTLAAGGSWALGRRGRSAAAGALRRSRAATCAWTPCSGGCSPRTSVARARRGFVTRLQLRPRAVAARASSPPRPAVLPPPPPQRGQRERERTAAEHPSPGLAAPPPMPQPLRGCDRAAGARRSVTSAWPPRGARVGPAEPRARQRDPRPAMARLALRGAGCPLSAR